MRLSLEMPGLLLAGAGLDTIATAARGLNIPTIQVSGSEEAMASYRSSGHTLVILDIKPGNHFDPHTITRYKLHKVHHKHNSEIEYFVFRITFRFLLASSSEPRPGHY